MRYLIERCRACDSTDLVPVIDLGSQRISDFRADDSRPPEWPLKLMLCQHCSLSQLEVTTPRGLLYHDRYGYYSGVNEKVREDLEYVTRFALQVRPNPKSWLDIGCNDGTLLSFVNDRILRVGVDPVPKFAEAARQHANEIHTSYFSPDLFDAPFDVITSVSMFYDLDDPNEFVNGVRQVLAKDGIWVIQQNYLPNMLEQNSVDNICHEHITYFALAPLVHLLAAHDLEVTDVRYTPINGGSFRVAICHRGWMYPRPLVYKWLSDEADDGLHDPRTYHQFADRVGHQLNRLRRLVWDANARGQKVYIYGASTRGATIWQACGFGPGDVACAVERNPDKVGLWYSPIGVPIISEERARADHPDCMLVGPWWFRHQVVERERSYLDRGGRLVFPLPELEVVGG